MIRALIRQPKWLFLDEATSALDEENQARVYEEIRKGLPDSSLVSIGHREPISALGERVIRVVGS